MVENLLNDLWTVYFHDPADTDWTTSSYVRIGDIGTVEDFWCHADCWKSKISHGMFFVMRDGIFPCWDDVNNIDGGCISIKVLKEAMPEFWEDCCMKILGESILKPELRDKCWSLVNGISTSPKKHFCIIKIWVKSPEIAKKEWFDMMSTYYGDIIYKGNRDNIENDNVKRM
jgi:hypothetical protein